MKPSARKILIYLLLIVIPAALIVTGVLIFLNYQGDQVIDIKSGKIIGEDNDFFYAYRGLPYAEPPVGDLRFASPQPYIGKWEGTREFKKFGNKCSQYYHFDYNYLGDEDCLFLNVYLPKAVAKSKEKVPVIVFFHGGAFMFGSSNGYGAAHMMRLQSMILVTVNYRVGVLGFLSTEDDVIPGNFGLKDQVEALRWVQKNIGAFNGDPSKVTITGFSAGGASVQLHYMSQLTEGLFNNGISHSGVALNPWVLMENAKEKAHQIASFMNCSGNHEEVLTCLREKPAEDLVMLAKKFQPFLYNPFSPFGVVVEPPSETAFLTDHPMNILKSGNFKKLPWMVSQTQDEGLYPAAEFYDDDILKTINTEWNELAPHILDYNGTNSDEAIKLEVSRKIRQHYLNRFIISKANFVKFDNIITDRLFKHGAFEAIRLQSSLMPSFFYHFRFKDLTYNLTDTSDFIGIAHGTDIFLIYEHSSRVIPFSKEETDVSKKLLHLYFNFAKYNKAVYDDLEIDEATPESVNCLEISSSAKMVVLDESFGNVKFWDEIEATLQSKI